MTANSVIEIAKNEIGYLEKATNNMLNDKTANAGMNNYTKYGADRGCNGQAWCDAFIDWCFIQAYGHDKAKSLLGGFSNYTPTSAQYFKNMNAWYKTPAIGDVIFFKNSQRICHTGLVYKVDNFKVYTIEGNTSSGSSLVANGGCVAQKAYPLNYNKIEGYGRPNYNEDKVYPTLKVGSKGIYVTHVQKYLSLKGYQVGNIDGNYGIQTMSCVKHYQEDNNLIVDGIWGMECWNSVGK